MRSFLFGALLVLLTPSISSAVVVGLNDDVHFDYNGKANDFHIEGTVHSRGGVLPLIEEILVFGDPGTGTWTVAGYHVVRIAPEDFEFILDFKTDGYITYCQWIHFGIKFNVNAANIIANLKGWWTLNGAPMFQDGSSTEYKQVAVTGFEVVGEPGEQVMRIMNNTNLFIEMTALELAVSPTEVSLKDMFSTGLGRPGEQSPALPSVEWAKATNFVPPFLEPGQEVKISLSALGLQVPKGAFLLMRGGQAMKGSKTAATRTTADWGWFWEQHGQ